jgi:crossover junction endodeoxyribonuclease RuvC
MIVLGIDPGSRKTGWGVVSHRAGKSESVAQGTIVLGEKIPLPGRLVRLADTMDAILRDHRPDACAVELIFHAKNARSALVLGHARGVALCQVARAGVPLFEYTPMQVKQAVAGTGSAGKTQVGRMVKMLLGHSAPIEEDAADALALALTHAAAAKLLALK